jgi:ammonia channel protein AmtB
VFHIGFTVFEYGAVRHKNRDLVVLRHFLIFVISALCAFVVGFDIAYGSDFNENRYWFSQYFLNYEFQKSIGNYTSASVSESIMPELQSF